MDKNKNQELPDQDRHLPDDTPKTSLGKRILAGIGVLLMIFLVIMYTYSIATGQIFLW